jgi:fructose-specific phosphotransferase system IIC component
MDGLSTDLVGLLEFLLPGFIAAWVFYGLTSYPKTSQFERVVQALIYTLLIRAVVAALGLVFESTWNDEIRSFVSVIVALVLGLGLSGFANSDLFHAGVRALGLTRETSYPSE